MSTFVCNCMDEKYLLELWTVKEFSTREHSAVVSSVGEVHNRSGDCVHEGERDDLKGVEVKTRT